MEVVWSKAVSAVVLATFSLISGLFPLRVVHRRHRFGPSGQRFLKLMLCFSGGVLLATCFLHLIPDVREQFELALPVDSQMRNLFPVAELTICIGYFVIYAIEEIAEYFVCRSCEQSHHHHGEEEEEERRKAYYKNDPMSKSQLASVFTGSLVNYDVDCMSPVHSVHGGHREPHQIRDCKEYNKLHCDTQIGCHATEGCSLLGDVDDLNNPVAVDDYGSVLPDGKVCAPDLAGKNVETSHAVKSTLRGMMLIVGLSFHSIFEGMAIGLQTNQTGIWTSFAAVALHKFIMAFCVGIKLCSINSKVTFYVICMVTFALVSPVGIVIGTVVTEASWEEASGSAGGLLVASLQGVACGTLLYVTFFEVLARNEDKEPPSLLNFLAVFLGFFVIAAIHTMDTHPATLP